ncbi:hypothetical protein LEMLEM_LOCUS7330 [Lemmus lemmus]
MSPSGCWCLTDPARLTLHRRHLHFPYLPLPY